MADIKAIAMPKWGLEMSEGTLAKWHVNEGDPITKGQAIMDVETEKIANEVEADTTGVLRRKVANDGEVIVVGELMGVIASAEIDDAAIDDFVANFKSIAVGRVEASAASPAPAAAAPRAERAARSDVKASPRAKKLAESLGIDINDVEGSGNRISDKDVQAHFDAHGASGGASGGAAAPAAPVNEDVRTTPAVRKMAKELGVDLNVVQGTGNRGRITRDDVETASKAPAGAAMPVVAGENSYRVVALNTMRKTIARRLTEAKQTIPHIYLTVDVELDRLLARRQKVNAASDVKVSVNDLVIRACGLALKQVPDMNVQWHDDGLHVYEHADISMAVSIEGGLITPIIRAADKKSVQQIAVETKDLATRARAGKLTLDEIQGGTFSISNMGMLGIKSFDAVINPPQGAILAVGTGEERLVARNGSPAVATIMTVTLSCDHRAIDGALGAQFLAAFKDLIEEPLALVL